MSSRIVSIDPGETSGFVVLDLTGKVIDAGAYDRVALLHRLQGWVTDSLTQLVVYERFMLYSGKVGASKSFSDLPEVRVIGSITSMCEMYSIPTDSLPAGVYKSATEQWAPQSTKIKGVHIRDAWRLGTWYLINRLGSEVSLHLKSGRSFVVSKTGGRETTDD